MLSTTVHTAEYVFYGVMYTSGSVTIVVRVIMRIVIGVIGVPVPTPRYVATVSP